MKTTGHQRAVTAMTFLELVVIIAIIAILVVVILPQLARPRHHCGLRCVNNLKQIGLSVRIWANDNADKYPMQTSTNEGGTLEFADGPYAFRHFQSISNELSTPKVLVCPQDARRTYATNFAMDLDNTKLSYFVGLDATETTPQIFLAGDRNITNGLLPRNGTLLVTTNQTVGWTKQIHTNVGNICLADGSVQQLTSVGLRRAILETRIATNRLAIP